MDPTKTKQPTNSIRMLTHSTKLDKPQTAAKALHCYKLKYQIIPTILSQPLTVIRSLKVECKWPYTMSSATKCLGIPYKLLRKLDD